MEGRTHGGGGAESGEAVARDDDGIERLQQVYAVYPRPAGAAFILDAIVEHAARSDAAAPPYSIAAELLRQRRAEASSTAV